MNVTSYIFRALAGLVIATVFGTALSYLLGMVYAWAALAIQGESVAIGPGIMAGAFGVGAIQSLATLPAVIPLGAAAHTALLFLNWRGIVLHCVAGMVVAALAATIFGLLENFNTSIAFAVIVGVSGFIGGGLFWLAARPDRI